MLRISALCDIVVGLSPGLLVDYGIWFLLANVGSFSFIIFEECKGEIVDNLLLSNSHFLGRDFWVP